jgi:hypothetical protein
MAPFQKLVQFFGTILIAWVALFAGAGCAEAAETLREAAERCDLHVGVMPVDATWNAPERPGGLKFGVVVGVALVAPSTWAVSGLRSFEKSVVTRGPRNSRYDQKPFGIEAQRAGNMIAQGAAKRSPGSLAPDMSEALKGWNRL